MAGYNEDVLHLIAWFASCEPHSGYKTLKSFSRASNTARNATLPFIFRSVVLRRKWGSNTLRGLTVIQPFVRSFTFTPRVKNDSPGPKEIARRITLLADILCGCANLERLIFNIDADRASTALIVSALQMSKLQLPSVRILAVMAAALPLFLEHVCQHVTVLSVFLSDSESAPVTAATVAGSSISLDITHLELRGSGWMSRHSIAIAILEKMPNVQNLTVDCRRLSLTQIENSLRIWESPVNAVQTLCLADITSLKLGFFVPVRGQADCGRSLRVNHLDRLAQRAREMFPRIQTLWVGETLIPGCEPIMDVPDQPLASAFMRDMHENSRAWRGLHEHDGAHFAIVTF